MWYVPYYPPQGQYYNEAVANGGILTIQDGNILYSNGRSTPITPAIQAQIPPPPIQPQTTKEAAADLQQKVVQQTPKT